MHLENWKRSTAIASCTLALNIAAMVGCTDDETTPADAGDAPGDDGGDLDAGTNDGGGHHGGDGDGGAGDGGVDEEVYIEGDRRVPFTPMNDLAFAQFFIEHHQMAIDMAEHEAENGADADVKALATRMVEAQTAELAILQAAVDAVGDQQEAPPAMPADPHAEAEMEHMMTLSGAELDEMFLLDMIPHHASALPVAHRGPEHLTREGLKDLALKMFEDQAREIGEMEGMLAGMGVTAAGEDMAEADGARPDMGLEGDRRIPMTPTDDVEFIDFFVPHHEMAMHMAEEVVARGEDAEVKALAEMMVEMQMAEVQAMRDLRMQLAGSPDSPPMPRDPHADPEMAAMQEMSGAELDHMFLEEMIPHHATALPTAHRAVPHVMDSALRTMAAEMYHAQAREIGKLRALLDAREME